LAAFLKANASSLNIRCCVISHISAYPSVVLPIAAITRLLRSYNIITIIDGAHAVGNIDIDVSIVDPDYYFGNMHKWFYSPKSAALL
jgi:selenocysteine lyase/cysteine desulfurase